MSYFDNITNSWQKLLSWAFPSSSKAKSDAAMIAAEKFWSDIPVAGCFGLMGYAGTTGDGIIHPDDFLKSQLCHSGKVCQIGPLDGDYLTLNYGDQTIRAKPKFFHLIPTPQWKWDDQVAVPSRRTVHQAIVIGMGWHFKRGKMYYVLQFGSRISTRWYWEEEISSPDPNAGGIVSPASNNPLDESNKQL